MYYNSTCSLQRRSSTLVPLLCQAQRHLPVLDKVRKRPPEVAKNLASHPSHKLLRCWKWALLGRKEGKDGIDTLLTSRHHYFSQQA